MYIQRSRTNSPLRPPLGTYSFEFTHEYNTASMGFDQGQETGSETCYFEDMKAIYIHMYLRSKTGS